MHPQTEGYERQRQRLESEEQKSHLSEFFSSVKKFLSETGRRVERGFDPDRRDFLRLGGSVAATTATAGFAAAEDDTKYQSVESVDDLDEGYIGEHVEVEAFVDYESSEMAWEVSAPEGKFLRSEDNERDFEIYDTRQSEEGLDAVTDGAANVENAGRFNLLNYISTNFDSSVDALDNIEGVSDSQYRLRGKLVENTEIDQYRDDQYVLEVEEAEKVS